MRRMVVVAALGAVAFAAVPSRAAAGGLDLRAGAFIPRAESDLFDDTNELFGVEKDDWIGFTGGAEWSFNVADHVELGLHVDGYGRELDTEYVDFERPDGSLIFQTLKLTTVPAGATLRFVANPGRGRLTPYVGVGVDVVYYEYEEFGDFIDFSDEINLPVRSDFFVDSGAAFGVHAAAGLRFPIGDDFSVVAEGRYLWAKTDMGEDFSLNEIDLGGPSATIGINLRF